jgi:tyrosyl-tRNA synthetase
MKLWFPGEANKFVIDDKILILRKGKHNVRIIELVSDEEWKASGKVYPGEPYTGMMRRVVKKLKEEAEERGDDVSEADIRRKLRKERDAEPGYVANNPDIQLPSKSEVREKAASSRGRTNTSQRGH